ncbi:MAG: hypothetical protein OCD02_18875 [Spirochaetaceae bacterium]
MKYFKPLIFYLLTITLYFLLLLAIAGGVLSLSLFYIGKSFVIFNLLFATLYFYINHNSNIISIVIVSVYAICITLLLLEVFYPKSLINNLILNPPENRSVIEPNNSTNEKSIVEIPQSNIDRAKYYLDLKEYTSAWIYSDFVVESGIGNITEANKIKKDAESKLKSASIKKNNVKYIETLKYKNMINQKRYLDAYYFSLNNLNNVIYDHDFIIKLKNSYHILLQDYYSIDLVESALKLPGYTDIKFYNTKGKFEKYYIEKIVYNNGGYYIKNLKINNENYPYIYIDKNGQLFSSGFKENEVFVINKDKPDIIMNPEDLKLYSKEFYKLSQSSLHFNMRVFNNKYVKYFEDIVLSELILSRLTNYSLIIIIFFMAQLGMKNRDYLNYLFNTSFLLFSIKWFIKKIGLILMFTGLNLSIIIVSIIFSIWLIILIKKVTLSRALF